MACSRLTLRVEKAGDAMLVLAAGEFDASRAEAVVRLADHPLNRSRRIIVDLAGITYLDSNGVYALIALQQRTLGFQLRNPSPAVADVLRLAGLDVWFNPLN